jgi:hypothetical protein
MKQLLNKTWEVVNVLHYITSTRQVVLNLGPKGPSDEIDAHWRGFKYYKTMVHQNLTGNREHKMAQVYAIEII